MDTVKCSGSHSTLGVLAFSCTAGRNARGTTDARSGNGRAAVQSRRLHEMLDLQFLPKLLLQHDSSPQTILEDVQTAFLQAVKQRDVQASISPSG